MVVGVPEHVQGYLASKVSVLLCAIDVRQVLGRSGWRLGGRVKGDPPPPSAPLRTSAGSVRVRVLISELQQALIITYWDNGEDRGKKKLLRG